MRALAMPDAECPRCNATQPPPESVLATCARCGLVFKPHEIEHKRRLDLVEPPSELPGVTITAVKGEIVIRWPLDRVVSLFYGFLLFVLWALVSIAPPSTGAYVICAVPTAVVLYTFVNSLVSRHALTITPERITYDVRPLPRLFVRARSFDRKAIDSVQMVHTRNLVVGYHYTFRVRDTRVRTLCKAFDLDAADSIASILNNLVLD